MDIVQLLMALVVAYLDGNYPSKNLKGVLSPDKRAKVLEVMPGLKVALDNYDAGEEIDWSSAVQTLRDFLAEYSRSKEAKQSFIQVLKTFISYYNSGSETAMRNIVKLSGRAEDPYLRSFFKAEVQGQSGPKNQLLKLVPKLGGSKGAHTLTLEQSKAARLKNPELYAEYLANMRAFNLSWKSALDNYIRDSGKKTIPFKQAEAYLKSLGMDHTQSKGFTGNIDAHGNWYTSDGKEINGTPTAAMFPEVRMNTDSKGSWVFQTVGLDGSLGNHFYTKDFGRKKAAEKFAKVKEFNVEATRKKWIPLIRSFDESSPNTVAAVIMELLYRTSNRVGTPGGNATGGAFGMATVQVRHVYPQNDGSIKFIYSGKDNVRTVALIPANKDAIGKLVCQHVALLIQNKKPKEPVFTYLLKNGSRKPVLPAVVNQYFKVMSGGVTVHKLRAAKGSEIFTEYLDILFQKKKTMSPAEAMEFLKKGAMKVGKELNHVRRSAEGTQTITPATSLKSYIDPALQVKFFQHYGLPLPKYLEAMLSKPELSGLVEEAVKKPKRNKDDEPAAEEGIDPMAEDKEEKPKEKEVVKKDPADKGMAGETECDELLLDALTEGTLYELFDEHFDAF